MAVAAKSNKICGTPVTVISYPDDVMKLQCDDVPASWVRTLVPGFTQHFITNRWTWVHAGRCLLVGCLLLDHYMTLLSPTCRVNQRRKLCSLLWPSRRCQPGIRLSVHPTAVTVVVWLRYVPLLRAPDHPVLAAPAPATTVALNMPRPGWRVNSQYGPLLTLIIHLS